MGKIIYLEEYRKRKEEIERQKYREFWENFSLSGELEENFDKDGFLKEIEEMLQK